MTRPHINKQQKRLTSMHPNKEDTKDNFIFKKE